MEGVSGGNEGSRWEKQRRGVGGEDVVGVAKVTGEPVITKKGRCTDGSLACLGTDEDQDGSDCKFRGM